MIVKNQEVGSTQMLLEIKMMTMMNSKMQDQKYSTVFMKNSIHNSIHKAGIKLH